MDENNINVNFENHENNEMKGISNSNRIGNVEFLETVDQGMCLSMHQPWASLLIAGIKM